VRTVAHAAADKNAEGALRVAIPASVTLNRGPWIPLAVAFSPSNRLHNASFPARF
jgi:hypothetical protein